MNKKLKVTIWAALGFALVLGAAGVFDISAAIDFLIGGGVVLAATPGVAVGTVISGTTTVEKAKELADPDYLKIDWDKKIVMIAPNQNVVDTLARSLGNTRETKSIETGGWEISVRDIEDKLLADVTADETDAVYDIQVSKPLIWDRGDTMKVFSTTSNITTAYTFYVEERKNTQIGAANLTVRLIGVESTEKAPALTATGSAIIRLARAMSETDAQTTPTYQTPSNRTNYCQIHMTQVEESVIHALHEKEVAVDFATLKEQALFEFRRDMELSNLFGVKSSILNNKGERVYTAAGLFEQIEKKYVRSGSGGWSLPDWVSMTREIFDGNNGSDRRICLVGAELMEKWSAIDAVNKQFNFSGIETVHGIRFNKIITNFGELLVKSASGVMVGPYANQGIVIDPAYIRKDVYEPLNVTPLDLDKTGQRRVNALRILENYCLIVENQPVHCIING